MWDIHGIYLKAEVAYRHEQIARDFRQAAGPHGGRIAPRRRQQRTAFPPAHPQGAATDCMSPSGEAIAAGVGGRGGHVRR